MEWTKEHENILIDWADKAMCYRWLHAKSNNMYSRLNAWFTIPVIIMSTVTGTANFAQERVPINYRQYYTMIIGGINITAGIITTIQQFLKISELNESHRVSSLSWDKFYRKIRVELSKPRHERQNVQDFLKHCTEEFDRLMEISPTIQNKIIEKFHKTFENTKLDEKSLNMFKELKKPEICDTLESIRFSINQTDELEHIKKNKLTNLIKDVIGEIDNKDNLIPKYNLIKEFIHDFQQEYNRNPTTLEIFNNLNDEHLGIEMNIINEYVETISKIENENIDNNQNIV